MSFYADYLKEKTNDLVIETDEGFITYRFLNNNKTVYITDIYIVPACRRKHVASSFANEVVKEAKKVGATELIGSIVPSNKNSTASLHVLLGYGMLLNSANNDFIVFRKEI